jgi:hypothetical protein
MFDIPGQQQPTEMTRVGMKRHVLCVQRLNLRDRTDLQFPALGSNAGKENYQFSDPRVAASLL